MKSEVPVPPPPIAGARTEWRDNWTLGASTLHMEIMEAASRAVWLAQEAVTEEQFDALVAPQGFVKTGLGRSVADVAWFARSPGADCDAPLDTLDSSGVRFVRVARPGTPEPGFRGVLVLPVHKHHSLLYRAGRTLEVMRFGDGLNYVPVVTEARGPGVVRAQREAARVLPEGWTVRRVTLARELLVELPNPARVAFFANGDSFQGPVRLEL